MVPAGLGPPSRTTRTLAPLALGLDREPHGSRPESIEPCARKGGGGRTARDQWRMVFDMRSQKRINFFLSTVVCENFSFNND
jgi:hypothetical protein